MKGDIRMKNKILLTSALIVLIVSFSFAQSNQMVLVEGGTFQMGDASLPDAPVHTVTVSSFYMSKYKVSLNEYGSLMGVWPINYNGGIVWNTPAPASEYGQIPAFGITWYEAIVYCNKLSVREGLTPCYASNGSKNAVTNARNFDKDYMTSKGTLILKNVTCDWNANGYRLPTEAEWEYAARGGKYKSPYKYAGSNDWREVMNIKMPFKMGTKKPNALGLHDMSMGPEWCWDLYGDFYYSQTNNSTDPRGPSGDQEYLGNGKWTAYLYERMQRGGRYYDERPEETSMVYKRFSDNPEKFEIIVGPTEYNFRIVRNANTNISNQPSLSATTKNNVNNSSKKINMPNWYYASELSEWRSYIEETLSDEIRIELIFKIMEQRIKQQISRGYVITKNDLRYCELAFKNWHYGDKKVPENFDISGKKLSDSKMAKILNELINQGYF